MEEKVFCRESPTSRTTVWLGYPFEPNHFMEITDLLEWNYYESDELCGWLTLPEIYEQAASMFSSKHIFTVYADGPLSGAIYITGNHGQICSWELWGVTRGYA